MFERPYTLSNRGLNQLLRDLRRFNEEYLPQKCEELVRRLVQYGATEAVVRIGESPIGSQITIQTDISREKTGTQAMIIMIGDVKYSDEYDPFYFALAIEFGVGIVQNGLNFNPKSAEMGFGPGTFPGQIHALDPNGWYYWDEETLTWRHSTGLRATMPMYRAMLEIQNRIAETAREVFNGVI